MMIQTTWSMRVAVDVTPQGRVVVMAKGLSAMGEVATGVVTAFPTDVAVPVLELAIGVVGDGCAEAPAEVPAEGAWQPVVRQTEADTATATTNLTSIPGRTLSDPPFTVIPP
ncbi:MAG: hypothetical protein NTU50_03740, partial [Actinobacteria bacterium]|nr:hypothetical protein [Actinomycetota bacterium]